MKGVISDPLAPLESLAGLLLKKSFKPPPTPAPPFEEWTSSGYIQQLHCQVDCIWQIYLSLSYKDSVGLPLVQSQVVLDGHPVTLFHGDKPVAEGSIVWPHPKSIEAIDSNEGSKRRINITKTRSLIILTQVLVPGAIHALHSQCMQWIYEHGKQAVVTTSTLRSRAVVPLPCISLNHAFLSPAPPSYILDEHNIPALTLSIPGPGQSFSQLKNQDLSSLGIDDSDSGEGDESEGQVEHFGEEV